MIALDFKPCRTPHQERIEKFMRKAGQELPDRPLIPTAEVRKLRARLILEEALETVAALGYDVYAGDMVKVDMDSSEFYSRHSPDLVGIVDGCCDLSVVTIGTLSACGIPDIPVLTLVDYNNLEKFGEGGYRDEGGKWIKPPDHGPPDIEGFLATLRKECE